MGSKGSKPRKPSHSQHLPKVGTPEENAREQRGARRAVTDNMSLGGPSGRSGVVIGAIAVIAVFGAILGLLALTTFR